MASMRINEGDYSRVIAVGDLHGHHVPLLRLLEKLAVRDSDLLIFIGDYIDRGPDSKDLIQELIELHDTHTNVVFLKGNHEDMMLGSLGMDALVSDMDTWLYNGGSSTLRSYKVDTASIGGITSFRNINEAVTALILESIPEDHLDFLSSLENYVESENFFFCHAGVDPYRRIEEGKHNVYNLLWMREHLYAEHPLWEKTVVCGHTPLEDILKTDNLICIDTGLHYFGRLTAIDVLTGEVTQVRS
jgi:serine/threonine protein phosphatase 1